MEKDDPVFGRCEANGRGLFRQYGPFSSEQREGGVIAHFPPTRERALRRAKRL